MYQFRDIKQMRKISKIKLKTFSKRNSIKQQLNAYNFSLRQHHDECRMPQDLPVLSIEEARKR